MPNPSPGTAKYLVRQRRFLGMRKRDWGFGDVPSYSRWKTDDRFPTQPEAEAYAKTLVGSGKVEVVVTLKGKVLFRKKV